MALRRLLPACVVLLLLAVACASGGDPGTDDGNEAGVASDSGVGSDATSSGHDSGSAGDDAATGTDTSTGGDATSGDDTGAVESGTDSGVDTGIDTGVDAGMDTGTVDTGTDTGVVEASVDTGTDAPVGNPNCATQCSGCCDVNNVCYTTHTDTECPENNAPGMTGQACVDCTAMGFHCILDIIEYVCFP